MTDSILINEYPEQVASALADREKHSGFASAQKLSREITRIETLIKATPGMGGDYRDGRVLTWNVFDTHTIYYQANLDKEVEFLSFLYKWEIR